MAERDFPEGFCWGAASCPACCEGETVSDWARFAAPDGSVPDDGPRHWRRYRYDFRAMAEMGLTAYRFGCDWGRLQRGPYQPLHREDSFRYLEMLAELRGLGIAPWLVLFQNALPRWLSAAGGWRNPETPHWFTDYSRRLADLTDGEVDHWITFHEPQMYAMSGYAWGRFPGGSWGRLDLVHRALLAMRKGHRLAAEAIRRRLPDAKIGLSLPGGCFLPGCRWHPGDWLAAGLAEWVMNRAGLRGFLRGGGACDFLMMGIGNEISVRARDSLSLSSGLSSSIARRMRHDCCGVDAAQRRKRVLGWIRKRRLPIYLVGSVAMDDDGGALRDLLAACAQSGADAPAGFFYDPLLDQFDLERGLTAGRGLLRVDYHGYERRREMRPLAWEFGAVARSGRLRP